MKMKDNELWKWIELAIGAAAFMVLYLWASSAVDKCEDRGGVLVTGFGGVACVESMP